MKKYRILPLLLIVCLLLTAAFPAAAAKNTADNSADTPQSTANVSSDGVPQSTVQAQEGSYVFGSDAVKSALDEKLGANCVLLADEDSGQYYYTRNIDAKAYPASLTKIMTLLLAVEAVERGDVHLDDTVTAYDDCNADMVEGASNADIKVGETMTFEDFLYCAMISSANEACNVVAEYVCGSISAFVQRMNERAQALGCTGTHFVNPHGLPNDDHYTTAHDLYRITKEALSHELFATICNTVKHTVPATNLSDERTLSNTNGLINPESPMYRGYYYEYAKGVKTGHTDAAGYCLISTAEKDGVRLLCVVLGGKGTTRANGTTDFGSFSDTLTAYRWVFSNYGWRDIVSASDLVCEVPVRYGRDSDGVTVRPAQSISAVLPSADAGGAPQFEQQVTLYSERDGKPLEAPVKAGDEVGELTVSYDGTVYGTVKLVAAVDVAVSKGAYIGGHLRAFFTNPIVLVVLLLVVLAVIGYVLWLARRRKQLEAERKRRRRAQNAGSAKPEKGAKKPEENRAEAQIVPTPDFKPDEQPSSTPARDALRRAEGEENRRRRAQQEVPTDKTLRVAPVEERPEFTPQGKVDDSKTRIFGRLDVEGALKEEQAKAEAPKADEEKTEAAQETIRLSGEDVQKLKTQAREDHFGVKGKKREEIKPMKKKKGLFGLGKKKDEDDDFLIDASDDDQDDDDLFE